MFLLIVIVPMRFTQELIDNVIFEVFCRRSIVFSFGFHSIPAQDITGMTVIIDITGMTFSCNFELILIELYRHDIN